MKLNIFCISVAMALFTIGCSHSHNHADAHGHDHENEGGHVVNEDEHPEHAEHADKEAEHDERGHEKEAACDGHANEIAFTKHQAKAAGLKTETVKASDFQNVIKTSGQIQVPQGAEQTIVATGAGVVSFANGSVADGAPVRKGETFVTISAQNLQDGDPALKAKLAFEAAEKEYRRAERLVDDKIISEKEFEQTRLRYETAKAVYQAQATNMTASGVRVPSPMTGYIKNRLVNQGDYVAVGQPIATVTQNKRLQLRAEVSEKYFGQLKNVKTANFRTSYEDVTYKLSQMNGKLLSYGKSSDNASFYIPVTFEFDNVIDVISGSFVEVFLLASPRADVISVPVSAITEEQGLYFVYVQVEPEAYVKREVRLGQNNGERVEITHGLVGGEKVVIQGTVQVKLASASNAIPHGHNH